MNNNNNPQPTHIKDLIHLLLPGGRGGSGGDCGDFDSSVVTGQEKIEEEPTQLEITILPDRPMEEDDNVDDDDNDVVDDDAIGIGNSIQNSNGKDDTYYFLKDGIHLGIHAPNVPKLARIFRNEYYYIRTLYLQQLQCHQNTQQKENEMIVQHRLWDVTKCLLLLCPDHASAWSDRKRLLEQMCFDVRRIFKINENHEGRGDADDNDNSIMECLECILHKWQDEMTFLNLLFTQHSKAPNSWAHRKWVSKQMIHVITQMKNVTNSTSSHTSTQQNTSSPSPSSSVLERISQWTHKEIELCTIIAEEKPKNYYAWTYRRFVIDTIILLLLNTNTFHNNNSNNINNNDVIIMKKCQNYVSEVVSSEFDFIYSSWIVKHVSDHSAVHYGGELLRIMIFLRVGSDRDSSSFFARFQKRYNSIVGSSIPSWKRLDSRQKHCNNNKNNNFNNNGVNNNDDILIWIEDTMKNILSKSHELILQYPSNEVIWVWRRICSQIYLDCLKEVQVHVGELRKSVLVLDENDDDKDDINTTNNDGDGNDEAASIQFVKKEIEDITTSKQRHKAALKEDEYELKRYQLYSSTYILWLIEYLRKSLGTTRSIRLLSGDDVSKLEVRLIGELLNSKDDGDDDHESISSSVVPSNYWQLKEMV